MGITFFSLHMFRMTVFFVLAGFFARLSMNYRGADHFARDRAIRIGIPLAIALPLVTLADAATKWVFANPEALDFAEFLPELSLRFTFLYHLWFLYYLLIFYVLTWACRKLLMVHFRSDGGILQIADAAIERIVSGPGGALIMSLPLFFMFLWWKWLFLWLGIPTPNTSFVPNPTALVAYGTAFLFGWMLHRQQHLLRQLERRSTVHLVAAITLGAVCLTIIGPTGNKEAGLSQAGKLAYAGCYAAGTWYASFAVLGLSMRFLSRRSPLMRYLADASYWIYLIHFPIIAALYAWLSPLEIAWPVLLLILVLGTSALSLVTYHYWVRHTFIGAVLKRRRPAS